MNTIKRLKGGLAILFIVLLFIVSYSIINASAEDLSVSNTTTSSASGTATGANMLYCTYTYSEWTACDNGSQHRVITAQTPTNCIVKEAPVVSKSCTLPACQASDIACSDWSACNNGVKTQSCHKTTNCLGDIQATKTETCVVPCAGYVYSDWSACISNKQIRTVTGRTPASCQGGASPVLEQSCTSAVSNDNTSTTQSSATQNSSETTTNTTDNAQTTTNSQTTTETIVTPKNTCSKDEWKCSDWSACHKKSGADYCIKARNCSLTYDCPNVTSQMPAEEICNCPIEQPAYTECQIIIGNWGNCVNGKQHGQEVQRSPAGCQGEAPAEAFVRDCENQETVTTPIRSNETIPVKNDEPKKTEQPTKLIDRPTTKDNKSNNSNDNQSVVVPVKTDLPVTTVPATSQTAAATQDNGAVLAPAATPDPGSLTKNTISAEIPNECKMAGFSTKQDCELYLRQTRIVQECYLKNIKTRQACKDYLLSTYGKPDKCADLTESECSKLISGVILSDFVENTISESTQKILSESANQGASVVASDNKVILKDGQSLNVNNLPFSSTAGEVKGRLVGVQIAAGSKAVPVSMVFDADNDGLSDDAEIRIGTDPNNPDTDGDGYTDGEEVAKGYNPLGKGKLKENPSPIDVAIAKGLTLEQPKTKAIKPVDSIKVISADSFEVDKLKATSKMKLSGIAKPKQVVTLYIYSQMPIIVTAQADANGNWVYDLDKTLSNGKHEVYVAVNDDAGKIKSQSVPMSFFVKEAKAVTMDEYVRLDDSIQQPDNFRNMLMFYVAGGLLLIVVLVSMFVYVRDRVSE